MKEAKKKRAHTEFLQRKWNAQYARHLCDVRAPIWSCARWNLHILCGACVFISFCYHFAATIRTHSTDYLFFAYLIEKWSTELTSSLRMPSTFSASTTTVVRQLVVKINRESKTTLKTSKKKRNSVRWIRFSPHLMLKINSNHLGTTNTLKTLSEEHMLSAVFLSSFFYVCFFVFIHLLFWKGTRIFECFTFLME